MIRDLSAAPALDPSLWRSDRQHTAVTQAKSVPVTHTRRCVAGRQQIWFLQRQAGAPHKDLETPPGGTHCNDLWSSLEGDWIRTLP